MDGWDGQGEGINSFAVVSYLSGPLAGFLDRARGDLTPQYPAKAHITVLPPRSLSAEPAEAWQEVQPRLQDVQPFRVELGEVAAFPESRVIYLSLRGGAAELERLHTALNTGRLACQEPFPYHPHLTIAQEVPPDQAAAAMETASRRWREFSGPRAFTVERLTFVQNTTGNRWRDLADMDLASRVTL